MSKRSRRRIEREVLQHFSRAVGLALGGYQQWNNGSSLPFLGPPFLSLPFSVFCSSLFRLLFSIFPFRSSIFNLPFSDFCSQSCLFQSSYLRSSASSVDQLISRPVRAWSPAEVCAGASRRASPRCRRTTPLSSPLVSCPLPEFGRTRPGSSDESAYRTRPRPV